MCITDTTDTIFCYADKISKGYFLNVVRMTKDLVHSVRTISGTIHSQLRVAKTFIVEGCKHKHKHHVAAKFSRLSTDAIMAERSNTPAVSSHSCASHGFESRLTLIQVQGFLRFGTV